LRQEAVATRCQVIIIFKMEILFSNKKKGSTKIEEFFDKKNPLADNNIDEIIDTLNEISNYWLSKNFKMRDIFVRNSLGFIIPWLSKKNSLEILKLSFENYKILDDPTSFSKKNLKLFGRPCGTALHWLAGNVPVISLISLFQGLITKNKNIIKVSKSYKKLLPSIFEDIKKNLKTSKKFKKVIENILNSLLIIYVDHDDDLSLNFLSKKSDIRIIWGGEKAVTKIAKLPKKINCRDIIFGPKISIAYISKTKIQKRDNIKEFAELFVNDVFNFDQLGCNSPHNLFIEKGSKFKLIQIAEILSRSFNKKILKINSYTDPANKYNILVKNFIHCLDKGNKSLSGKNFEWNIYINKQTKVEDPLYNRSIFINEVKDYNELINIMPTNTQSVGIYASHEEKKQIVKKLSYKFVDRFPEIGSMSLYQNPWDGYLPMQNMIRWISY